MSSKSFILSASGLKNVIFRSIQKEEQFVFVIGDKEIEMNRHLAEFISPRVSHIHQTDPTIDRIQLIPPGQSRENIFSSDFYDKFQKLSRGDKIDIDEEMSEQLRKLSIYLDNEEIYSEMKSLFPMKYEEDQLEEYLKYIIEIENTEKESYNKINILKESYIEFIASHFYLINQKQQHLINKSTLYHIICNEHLQLKDEDSLYEIINELYSNEKYDEDEDKEEEEEFPSKTDLIENILISELSEENKKQFISTLETKELSSQLWENIRYFLLNLIDNKTNKTNNEKRYFKSEKQKQSENSIEVIFTNNIEDRFKGILSKLGNGDARNALNQGIINITCSSVYSNSDHNQAKNVVDYGNDDKIFQSKKEENSWLCIDFILNKVRPSHYSIRATGYGSNNCSLLNWCIEGSNDQETWQELDRRSNEQSLRENRSSNTFNIQASLKNDEYYQYLRIRSTDVNSSYDHRLVFSSIEFFGTIHK